MQIICLKWGDRFTEEHVNRLYRMVCKNYHDDFTFICYTENSSGIHPDIKIIPLELDYDLEKWWWKLTLFKYSSDDPKLFLDLDIVIQRDITHLKQYNKKNKLCLIKSYWKNYDSDVDINSSIMIWSGDLTDIFKKFEENVDYYMVKETGIDPFIFKNFMNKIHFLNEGECYSRLYGIDSNRFWDPKITKQPKSFFYDETYNICIFNGWKRRKKEYSKFKKEYDNLDQSFLLEDSGYAGFEKYWND